MHRIDIPPVWFAGCALLAWFQARLLPLGLSLEGGLTDLLSGVLIGGAVILVALAVTELRRHRTAIEPHAQPTQLVQSGIFRRSRNPIYLGLILLLTGLILRFDAVLSLALVPVFTWILERRFILPEEDRLRRTFRADYARYLQKTRRWI